MNYIISGDSHFLIQQEINKIINELAVDEMSTVKFSGLDINIDELIVECQMIPFLSENKLVIVENAEFLTSKANKDIKLDGLLEYLSKPNLSTTLILVVENDKLDGRKKIVKEIKKLCRVLNFEVDADNLNSTIMQMLNNAGVVLKKEVLKEFLNRSSNNLEEVKSNIDKLALYPDDITVEVIDELVMKPLASDEKYKFDFINAIYHRNGKKIFQLYDDFKLLGYDPLSLIGLIESQLRFVLQLKVLKSLHYTNDQISDELNAHPYRVKMVDKETRTFSGHEILLILNELCEIDVQSKKGLIDINQAFEIFLLKRSK